MIGLPRCTPLYIYAREDYIRYRWSGTATTRYFRNKILFIVCETSYYNKDSLGKCFSSFKQEHNLIINHELHCCKFHSFLLVKTFVSVSTFRSFLLFSTFPSQLGFIIIMDLIWALKWKWFSVFFSVNLRIDWNCFCLF